MVRADLHGLTSTGGTNADEQEFENFTTAQRTTLLGLLLACTRWDSSSAVRSLERYRTAFLFIAVLTGAALWRLILVSPPPFTGRQYPLLAVEISVVSIAFQPLNWMIRNLDLSSQSPHSDLAGVVMWRGIWLAIWALLFGVSFFVFCYQRLTSQSASPTPRL
jgi:hypothetical protein